MSKQTPAPSAVPEVISNSFATLMAELGDGECQNEASEKLTELVQAVSERCKSGELTIKIKITPAGSGRAMAIAYDVIVKPPKPEKECSFLFATEDGLLQRNNPDQRELPLRALPSNDLQSEKSVPSQTATPLKAVI